MFVTSLRTEAAKDSEQFVLMLEKKPKPLGKNWIEMTWETDLIGVH